MQTQHHSKVYSVMLGNKSRAVTFQSNLVILRTNLMMTGLGFGADIETINMISSMEVGQIITFIIIVGSVRGGCREIITI